MYLSTWVPSAGTLYQGQVVYSGGLQKKVKFSSVKARSSIELISGFNLPVKCFHRDVAITTSELFDVLLKILNCSHAMRRSNKRLVFVEARCVVSSCRTGLSASATYQSTAAMVCLPTLLELFATCNLSWKQVLTTIQMTLFTSKTSIDVPSANIFAVSR